jgi:hypothetical protein
MGMDIGAMGDSDSGEVDEQLLNPHPIKADDIEEKIMERGTECAHYAGMEDKT